MSKTMEIGPISNDYEVIKAIKNDERLSEKLKNLLIISAKTGAKMDISKFNLSMDEVDALLDTSLLEKNGIEGSIIEGDSSLVLLDYKKDLIEKKNKGIDIEYEEPEEEETKKEFIPKDPDEVKDLPKEKLEKMFYLTGDRIADMVSKMTPESLRMVFGKNLSTYELLEYKKQLEMVYRNCTDYAMLAHPKFFENNNSAFSRLPKDVSGSRLGSLHTHLLACTYVGYYSEEIDENSKSNIGSDGEIAGTDSMLNDVERRDELTTKDDTFEKRVINTFQEHMKTEVEHELKIANDYSDLYDLANSSAVFQKAKEDTLDNFPGGEQKEEVSRIIDNPPGEISDKAKDAVKDEQIEVNMYNIDWNNPSSRITAIEVLKKIKDNALDELGADQLVKTINIDFSISDTKDVASLNKCLNDMEELTNMGFDVTCMCDISVKNRMLIGNAVDDVFANHPSITRNNMAEMVNAIPEVAVGVAVATQVPEIAENMIPPELSEFEEMQVEDAIIYDFREVITNDELMERIEELAREEISGLSVEAQIIDLSEKSDRLPNEIRDLLDEKIEEIENEEEMGYSKSQGEEEQ